MSSKVPSLLYLTSVLHVIKSVLFIHRAALAPFLANKTAAPNSYKWILYSDDDTFWFIDNALVYLSQLDPDMPYLLSDNIWMKERNSGVSHLSMCNGIQWAIMLLDLNAVSKPFNQPNISFMVRIFCHCCGLRASLGTASECTRAAPIHEVS